MHELAGPAGARVGRRARRRPVGARHLYHSPRTLPFHHPCDPASNRTKVRHHLHDAPWRHAESPYEKMSWLTRWRRGGDLCVGGRRRRATTHDSRAHANSGRLRELRTPIYDHCVDHENRSTDSSDLELRCDTESLQVSIFTFSHILRAVNMCMCWSLTRKTWHGHPGRPYGSTLSTTRLAWP